MKSDLFGEHKISKGLKPFVYNGSERKVRFLPVYLLFPRVSQNFILHILKGFVSTIAID